MSDATIPLNRWIAPAGISGINQSGETKPCIYSNQHGVWHARSAQ